MALAAELLFWLSNKPKPPNQRANKDRERGKPWDEVTMTRQVEKPYFNVAQSRRWVDSSICDRIKKKKTNNQTVNKNDEMSLRRQKTKRMHDTCSRKLVNQQAKMMNWEVIGPSWWIGRFCPRQDKNDPAAMLICLHSDVKKSYPI